VKIKMKIQLRPLFIVAPLFLSVGHAYSAQTCAALNQRWGETDVQVGGTPAPNNEYTPAVIAPMASGESLLAWTDRTDSDIKLAKLNAKDQRTKALPTLKGLEVHDVISTPGGFALAVMDNDPDIYSAKYCQGEATPNNAVCGKMDLVLLDADGGQVARTTLTKKTNVDANQAYFIWWYGHTARLAEGDGRIAVYYRSALSVDRPNVPGEVDIHAGDSLKFVDASTGQLLNGGWDWGCSHSWAVRTAYNGNNWGAVCHGDAYPNAMRLARMNSPTASATHTTWLEGTDPSERALGGIVPTVDGFWMNYIQKENGKLTLKLSKFQDGSDQPEQTQTISFAKNLDTDYPFRAYMAKYGEDQLLIGWKSNGKLMLATVNSDNGEVVEGPVETSLSIDNFQEMKTATNGDVVWAYSSGSDQIIRVNRISSCP
jgi:hypothetical protein